MIRWLRTVFSVGAFDGRPSGEAPDAAVARGMADVLAALDNVIDDDAALGRVYAGLSVNGAAPDPGGGTAVIPAPPHERAARRRRAMLRPASLRPVRWPAAGLAAALAAGAVTLSVIVAPGPGHHSTAGPAVDTAYVLKRVDSALTSAGPGEIVQVTTTSGLVPVSRGSGATGRATTERWSYGGQWRLLAKLPGGQAAFELGFSPAAGSTQVSYPQRIWARSDEQPLAMAPTPSPPGFRAFPGPASSPASGASGCDQATVDLASLFGAPGNATQAGSLAATVAATLRSAVTCGALTVAGRQPVDGTEAIELTSRPGSPIPETVWVDPATYLPVRMVVHPYPGLPGGARTADITWLPPTAQNLAKLTVSVPAGFRQVTPAQISPYLHLTLRSPEGVK